MPGRPRVAGRGPGGGGGRARGVPLLPGPVPLLAPVPTAGLLPLQPLLSVHQVYGMYRF